MTFQVWSGGRVAHQRDIGAGEIADPVMVEIRDARDHEELRIAFLTRGEPTATRRDDPRTRWRGVKIVVGDAAVDVERVKSEELARAWSRFNPVNRGGPQSSRAVFRASR